jgi:hypothetical protein
MAGWGTGFHWWVWVLGIATTAIFWALVIWAIVALVRWAGHDGNGGAGPGAPPGPPGRTTSACRPWAGRLRRRVRHKGMDKSTLVDQLFRKPGFRPKFRHLYYCYWFRLST